MKLSGMPSSRRRAWKALISAYDGTNPATAAERAYQYLDENPTDGWAWLILGDILCDLARYGDASTAIRKAIRFVPGERRAMPYAQMGHLYREKGSLRAAVDGVRGTHFGKNLWRHLKKLEQIRVPSAGVNVVNQSARGICVIRYVRLTARQIPRNPGIDGAEK